MPLQRPALVPGRLLAFAKSLREEQPLAEAILWARLRDRRFLGLKFRRQHPIGPFIADFYCSDLRWVIELDGGQHNTDDARTYDRRRTEFLRTRGIEVTRFWNNDVTGEPEAVVERLVAMADELRERGRGRRGHPHPGPLPEGEGVRQHGFPSKDEQSTPLSLWERVAEGRVRVPGATPDQARPPAAEPDARAKATRNATTH